MKYAAYAICRVRSSGDCCIPRRGHGHWRGDTVAPSNFPAAVIVLLHISHPASYFPHILQRNSCLPVIWGEEGYPIRPGRIIVAPADRHMMIPDGCCHVAYFERINYARPSADILFETAASAFGNRVLGVILTGGGRDGAVGARAIKNAGGRILVQDQQSCECFEMCCSGNGSGGFYVALKSDSYGYPFAGRDSWCR